MNGCIYIALSLCIAAHPKRFTIIWGGGSLQTPPAFTSKAGGKAHNNLACVLYSINYSYLLRQSKSDSIKAEYNRDVLYLSSSLHLHQDRTLSPRPRQPRFFHFQLLAFISLSTIFLQHERLLFLLLLGHGGIKYHLEGPEHEFNNEMTLNRGRQQTSKRSKWRKQSWD